MYNADEITEMRARLLYWYDREGRKLPWRVRPEDRDKGIAPDPYAVWLSEIMLQQTTVAHGTPYWFKFLSLYPRVENLAAAPLDDILTHWAGLGYYARARNLHKCARIVRDELGGEFPQTKAELLTLPGIGDYTASTMAAICFDEPTSIVDGNVERVIARLHRIKVPMPKAKTMIKAKAKILADPDRPGDYGQALMDLGALICTPRNPDCASCVWAEFCGARATGDMEAFPVKKPKVALPIRHGHAFVAVRDGAVFLRRRPETGLLGGMMEVPTSEWADELPTLTPPVKGDWTRRPERIRHVFTHFELRLDVYSSEDANDFAGDGRWVPISQLSDEALPTLMRKVLGFLKT